MDPGLIELFVDGKEDGLPDSGRLDGLGLGEGSVVFLLFRQGWHWTACGSEMALSEDGLVATKKGCGWGSDEWQLATGGEPRLGGLRGCVFGSCDGFFLRVSFAGREGARGQRIESAAEEEAEARRRQRRG